MAFSPRKSNTVISLARGFWLATAVFMTIPGSAFAEPAQEFNASILAQNPTAKGVVLLSANWGRHWGCGGNENAQLRELGFDKIEATAKPAKQRPELFIEGSQSGNAAQIPFSNYVFLVDPGEYEFSAFRIHMARSMSRTWQLVGSRTDLFQQGRSKVGKFSVGPGETVYIGHFALDCAQTPMPWRFYPESRDDFEQYLAKVKLQYPELDTSKVVFRLFETKIIGQPFSLP